MHLSSKNKPSSSLVMQHFFLSLSLDTLPSMFSLDLNQLKKMNLKQTYELDKKNDRFLLVATLTRR